MPTIGAADADDTAFPGIGIGKLISAKLVGRVIVSHIGLNPETQQQMIAGGLEVELGASSRLIVQATEKGAANSYFLIGAMTCAIRP